MLFALDIALVYIRRGMIAGSRSRASRTLRVLSFHRPIFRTLDDLTCRGLDKSFSTLTDAERFLAGENPPSVRGSLPPSPKFYAVKNGRLPGIYTDWASAQKQITGWTRPRQKAFGTREEAQHFLEHDEDLTGINAESWDFANVTDGKDERPPTKRSKTAINSGSKGLRGGPTEYDESNYAAGDAPLPHCTKDGFDPNIILDPITGTVIYKTQEQRRATKIQGYWGAQNEMLRIYTDGSALGNGRTGALAGVGVYFGPGDHR